MEERTESIDVKCEYAHVDLLDVKNRNFFSPLLFPGDFHRLRNDRFKNRKQNLIFFPSLYTIRKWAQVWL